MIILPITLTAAGAAALLNVWIAIRVGSTRNRVGISIGDGGNEALIRRMRAHANFAEYAPFFLILLGLVELADGPKSWLWGFAVAFILGRILHVFGMDRPSPNRFRLIGMILSMLSLVGLAFYAIAIPYLHRAQPVSVTYAAANQPPASTLSATKGLVRRS
jgi:uncharacterized membrane protein YecN with MAPEG domain